MTHEQLLSFLFIKIKLDFFLISGKKKIIKVFFFIDD